MSRERIRGLLSAAAISAAIGVCTGCGLSMPTMVTPAAGAQGAQANPPNIWDCGLVSSGSPSKYVCGDKVYTTFQLAKIRADETKKYESGQ
jgi:hypothetical protein